MRGRRPLASRLSDGVFAIVSLLVPALGRVVAGHPATEPREQVASEATPAKTVAIEEAG
jgi:hypothetical protein